jgi:hypothetical protein
MNLERLETRVQNPGTNEFKQSQWLKALNWSPRPLDEGPRPKSGKLRLNLHDTCFGGKINWFGPKKSAKGEFLIWRTKNQARDQGTVQFKDSICFKSVQIGSYEVGPSSKVGRNLSSK